MIGILIQFFSSLKWNFIFGKEKSNLSEILITTLEVVKNIPNLKKKMVLDILNIIL